MVKKGLVAPKVGLALFLLASCGSEAPSSEEILASKQANPEPNIPLECYTDTGVVKLGRAIANPCYVCHTKANTPYANEVEDYDLTLSYDFPEEIKKIGNPWLNAVKPELTIGNIPVPSDEEIKSWIRTDNWREAYQNRGKGDLEYFPDVPPLYTYTGGSYSLNNAVVDNEGFIHDPDTGEYTGWRVFKWKPFPGFFPTNGRIDSTLIRLPEKFRTNRGSFDKGTYKKNLAILECAIKGVKPGEICRGTEVGDFTMSSRYEGNASDVEVVTFQYPPGTEFAHPVYYLDPDNAISFKSLRIKEIRYMRKLAYAPLQSSGEEEEEDEFFWDKGKVLNASGFWEMVGFIEDENGRLRPQTAEEMKFCIACHGGVGGSVDGTFTYWRKVPGSAGWKEQDYNLSSKDIKDWSYGALRCSNLSNVNVGDTIRSALEAYCSQYSDDVGEYAFYFSLTAGGDHFRSNEEILSRISADTNKISLVLSPSDNLITNPGLINYLDNNGYVKPELFLPSEGRAYGIDKQYYRVVKAQRFVYGRDVFDRAFGVSNGGNSLESLKEVDTTGVIESKIWVLMKTLLR